MTNEAHHESGGEATRSGNVPNIAVFTLFPALIEAHAHTSVLGRAQEQNVLRVSAHDLRSHGVGVHQSVDDAPFGGGAGMVLSAQPIFESVEARLESGKAVRPIFAMGPGGRRFDQRVARELAELMLTDGGFSLLCGRYEGFDQRVHEHLTDGEISLGDFVLGGGEVAAMAITEAVARLVPGVMGNQESAGEESFGTGLGGEQGGGLLEYPQYTRPAEFRGWPIPEVLRSGDHAKVARWRRVQAMVRTANQRPDLWARYPELTKAERKAFAEFGIDTPPQTFSEPSP
jgi:tRNA (guanine37-N1)-methyltransferase